MEMWAMPPLMWPTRQRETASRELAMVPFCMMSPATMKKGTASRGKESSALYIFCARNTGGRPPTIMPMKTAVPMETPMGTVKISRTMRVPNVVRRTGSILFPFTILC